MVVGVVVVDVDVVYDVVVHLAGLNIVVVDVVVV